MFWKRFHLLTIMGFPIHVDVSWFVVAVLFTWSLATTAFPQWTPGLSTLSYWSMGAVATLGLFGCILLHELGHAVVARRYRMVIRRITLFMFGGVAELEDEPPSARAEFFVAVAGPIVSVALALLFFGLWLVGSAAGLPIQAVAVLGHLTWINGMVVVFNLIPAFPLDGGRVLRSILWGAKDDLRWATRVTSRIGGAFGLVLIALGIFDFIRGNVVGGMWAALIGLFLRNAAAMSYQQLVLRHALAGESLDHFMNQPAVTVPADETIERLVDDYIYRYHHKVYPVVDGGRLVGCISTRDVKQIPREAWSRRTVGEVAGQCSRENTISADADPLAALSKMSRTGASGLMVVDGDRLLGMVSLKDMLGYLSRKLELEEEPA